MYENIMIDYVFHSVSLGLCTGIVFQENDLIKH